MTKDNQILQDLPFSYLEAAGPKVQKEVHEEMIAEQRRLREQSLKDSLTGLLNHGTFFMEAEQLWQETSRTGSPFSFVMLDIDWFKQYNDQKGHPAGDKVLLAMTSILQEIARKNTGMAGRWGGEEFILALKVNEETACQIAEKIRQEIIALNLNVIPPSHSDSAPLTASLGVISSKTQLPFEKLVEGVDRALYRAKGDRRGDGVNGRNRVAVYRASDQIEILKPEPDYVP